MLKQAKSDAQQSSFLSLCDLIGAWWQGALSAMVGMLTLDGGGFETAACAATDCVLTTANTSPVIRSSQRAQFSRYVISRLCHRAPMLARSPRKSSSAPLPAKNVRYVEADLTARAIVGYVEPVLQKPTVRLRSIVLKKSTLDIFHRLCGTMIQTRRPGPALLFP